MRARTGTVAAAAAAILVIIAASIGADAMSAAPFGFWQTLGRWSGTPDDSGPIDFATLTRRKTPNDALVCPPGTCPRAKADAEPPAFTINAQRLAEKMRDVALADARVQRLDDGSRPDVLRFVQRSALMRYPDIVDIRIIPLSAGAATLAIYSRSLVGSSDLGVNRKRVERWLAGLGA
jgi:uncharacterized protein (DUF1499 family)